MKQSQTCTVCGGTLESVVIENMVQHKCPYCGYTEAPRELMNQEEAAMSIKFRFLQQANALYAEILNNIAAPQNIKWPQKLLGEDINTYLNTPIYGMLYAAWLTKGFRDSMSSEIKAVVNAVYEPARSLKNRSAVLAVLINLYENSINQEQIRKKKKKRLITALGISAGVAAVAVLITGLVLLGSYAPSLMDKDTGASIRLTKDAVPMFKKSGLTFEVKKHPSTSARYVDAKSILRNETEIFSVFDLAVVKSEEKQNIDTVADFILPIPEGYDTTCLCVYYIEPSKNFALIPSTVSVEDNTIRFSEMKFGTYVIAERHPRIMFDPANGMEPMLDIVTRDTLIPMPETPTREGYNFKAWLCGDTEWNFQKNTATEDMTLVASWAPVEYYISYESNGGSVYDNTVYTIESSQITLPKPTRLGYVFDGWYADSSFKGKKYTSIDSGSIGDMELYAKWKYDSAVYQSPYNKITIDASYTKVHDSFSLENISPFLNSGYYITFTIEIYMYEKYAGYQEIYLCNNNQSHVWEKTNYEYGGGGSANKTASWVTFTCTIPGNLCTDVMNLMYGAHGDYSDDWVRAQVKVTATVSKA